MTTKTESRFYIGQTVIDIKDTLKNKFDAKTTKHIKTRITTGKKFISDLKQNPKKHLSSVVDENKTRVKNFTKNSKKTYNNFINDSKQTATKVTKGLKSDIKIITGDMTNLKTRTLNKFTVKESINKKISNIAKKIPSKLNLPSTEEIQNLMTGIDGINKKVDKLNNMYA